MASEKHNDHLEAEIALHRHLAQVYEEKRYAPAFSKLYNQHWNRKLCQVSQLPAGARVLDYGCGSGILFEELAARKYAYIGLDLSLDMLLAAKKKHPRAECVCADGLRLPFPDSGFDGVICRGSIHHLMSQREVFREIHRVLKPGGVLAFSEPSNDSLLNLVARFIMYRFSREFHEDDVAFNRRKILPLLKESGFSVEYSRGFGFLGYVLAGFPDKLGLLNHLPGACALTRLFILLDSLLERIPFLHALALHWQVRARKG